MKETDPCKLAVLVVVISLFTGCATTQMVSQVNWEVRDLGFDTVLVVGGFLDLQQAQLAESRLCAELRRRTACECVRYLDVFFPGQEYSVQETESRISQLQIDAVLTLEPIDSGKTSTYIPGKTYTTASASVYGNTVTGSSTTRTSPGYDIESPWVDLEARLWSVADAKSAWYATATSSGDFVGWNDLIRSAADRTVSNLVADGVFRNSRRRSTYLPRSQAPSDSQPSSTEPDTPTPPSIIDKLPIEVLLSVTQFARELVTLSAAEMDSTQVKILARVFKVPPGTIETFRWGNTAAPVGHPHYQTKWLTLWYGEGVDDKARQTIRFDTAGAVIEHTEVGSGQHSGGEPGKNSLLTERDSTPNTLVGIWVKNPQSLGSITWVFRKDGTYLYSQEFSSTTTRSTGPYSVSEWVITTTGPDCTLYNDGRADDCGASYTVLYDFSINEGSLTLVNQSSGDKGSYIRP